MSYPYANGIISAKIETILTRQKLTKLIGLNKSEIIKNLIDMGYGESKEKVSLEKLIDQELNKTKAFLNNLQIDKHLIDIFYLSYDLIKLKGIIKAKMFNQNFYSENNLGLFSNEAIEEALDGNYELISKSFIKLFVSINSKISKDFTSREVSSLIEEEVTSFILNNIKGSKSLKEYFEMIIDFSNIRTFIRCKKLSWSQDEMKSMLLSNGKIATSIYCDVFQKNDSEIVKIFSDYYQENLSNIVHKYFQNHNLSNLDFNLENLKLKLSEQLQFDVFGMGPIIDYYLKKEAEITNIKLIYLNTSISVDMLLGR